MSFVVLNGIHIKSLDIIVHQSVYFLCITDYFRSRMKCDIKPFYQLSNHHGHKKQEMAEKLIPRIEIMNILFDKNHDKMIIMDTDMKQAICFLFF